VVNAFPAHARCVDRTHLRTEGQWTPPATSRREPAISNTNGGTPASPRFPSPPPLRTRAQVALVLTQLQGVVDGYNHAANASTQVPFAAIWNIQLGGDLEDLEAAVGLQSPSRQPLPSSRVSARKRRQLAATHPDWSVMSPDARDALVARLSTRSWLNESAGLLSPNTEGGGHCSLGVKLTPGDLYVGQTDWSGFEEMVRIYKFVDLAFSGALRCAAVPPRCCTPHQCICPLAHAGSLPGRASSFSSMPGSLYSGDDYYVLQPSKLAVMETTIGNSNATLYSLYVKPDTVLDWIRNLVANRLATDAPSWASTFSRFNSGTYNNEFVVVDYKNFNAGGKPLPPNTVWVLDQAPGYIAAWDATAELQARSYLASYNVAADPFIFNITGMPALVQQYGPWFSHDGTARALIFAREQAKVTTLGDFQRMMRFNQFQTDPVATQGCSGHPPSSAENAIAARDDLNPANGTYPIDALGHRDHAAIDCKVTSGTLMARAGWSTTMAQAGPTYDDQAPFSWSTTTPDIAALGHEGQPDTWTMPWVTLAFPV